MINKLRVELISQSFSVAVITPYKAQVRRLKQVLRYAIELPEAVDRVREREIEREKEK